MATPTSVQTPASPPIISALTWYSSWEIPAASVQDFGTTSPPTCPMITNSSPKWNSGLPMRSSRDS
jgi:hypothetical protein